MPARTRTTPTACSGPTWSPRMIAEDATATGNSVEERMEPSPLPVRGTKRTTRKTGRTRKVSPSESIQTAARAAGATAGKRGQPANAAATGRRMTATAQVISERRTGVASPPKRDVSEKNPAKQNAARMANGAPRRFEALAAERKSAARTAPPTTRAAEATWIIGGGFRVTARLISWVNGT